MQWYLVEVWRFQFKFPQPVFDFTFNSFNHRVSLEFIFCPLAYFIAVPFKQGAGTHCFYLICGKSAIIIG